MNNPGCYGYGKTPGKHQRYFTRCYVCKMRQMCAKLSEPMKGKVTV